MAGESDVDAIIRETKEELGMTLPKSEVKLIIKLRRYKLPNKQFTSAYFIFCNYSEKDFKIYELEAEIGGKNELCDYLCEKFYNRFWGPHKRWPIWDIAAIAYLINKDWFKTMNISCPIINEDNTFTHTSGKHNITFVKQLNANNIYENLFESLIK